MASLAAMLHITRLRQALLSSAKEVGEVLSKALRADEASRVSQVVASFLDGPHASPAEEVPLTAAPADHSSSRVSVPTAHPAASSHVSEQRKGASFNNACDGPSFERAAFPSNSFSELCTTKTASREFDSRLNESEGWFLTDMISGCEDGSLHARMLRRGTNGSAASSVSSRSSRSRDHGSIVMVSSVESLLSEDKDDDVDSLSSGGSPKDEESSRSRHKLPISVSSVYPSAGEISGDVVETTTDLEQQAEQDNVPLLSELEKQCGDEAIYLINRKRICGGEKFYMIDAGHGWSGYQSLEHLLSFLRETVKVFGVDHLRTTKFLLPAEEAGGFLDRLRDIAPYSLNDFVSVAKAASSPVLIALAARFFFVQLTEAAFAWATATDVAVVTASGSVGAAGAAAAAAGETAAAATGAASLCSACSTAVAVMPWVILVGGCAYGVFCGVRKLRSIRREFFLCPTTDVGETGLEEGMLQDILHDHCIIKWGQPTGE